MFSKDLELSISQAYHAARSRRHEFLTVEHLLLALIDNPSARSGAAGLWRRFRPAGARTWTRCWTRPFPCCRRATARYAADRRLPARPAACVFHVQSSEKKEVTGRQRPGRDLQRAGLAGRLLPGQAGHHAARRRELHLARDLQERPAAAPVRTAPADAGRRGRGAQEIALETYATNLNERARRARSIR
jgi:ATP-dependent Clp protease ATP-binding subunit ClpA